MDVPANSQTMIYRSPHMELITAQGQSSFLQGLGVELVFTQDGSGQYHSFYWRNAQEYGLTEEHVVGDRLKDTFYPIALEAYRDQIQRILENRNPERCIHWFRYNKQNFPFELAISPILEADGKANKVLVIGHLLPESEVQKVIDSLVPYSLDPNQRLLTQIARKIRRTLDLDTIWQQTVESLGRAMQVNRCIVCSYKQGDEGVKVEAEYCHESFASMLGKQLELESEPELKQALLRAEPVVVESISIGEFQQQSILVVSTCYKDQPNGLISLHQCDRRRQWSNAEIELVRELAEQVGTAIAHGTLYKELEIATEQAEEASRLKSEFLANTSHELRTPLNGMIGFLRLVIDEVADDPEEEKEFIQEAHNSAIHLLNIINDILDIAKIEAGKMELELGPQELDSLFKKVYDLQKQQAQQKNLTLTIEMPRNLEGITVYSNYQRLLQVLLNLVGNAIKFTEEGGVTISAEAIRQTVKFKDEELPGYVKVRVADTGIGVSLDKQDKLFQSFSQVHSGLNRPYGGTGLGLAISQKLVETMGGVMNFFSMGEGLGSTVTFSVPLFQDPVVRSEVREDY